MCVRDQNVKLTKLVTGLNFHYTKSKYLAYTGNLLLTKNQVEIISTIDRDDARTTEFHVTPPKSI